jgi:heptosyltransferase-1
MTSILLVRMSSLGDIVHTFPAVTDMRRACPQAEIHWVVEEAYRSLATMHPAVDRVIPVAIRRWRTRLLAPATWREVSAARAVLEATDYDLVLDTQGLWKSLAVARIARRATRRRGHASVLHGFGPGTIRERVSTRRYDVTHEFDAADHKITRYRTVAAEALGAAVGREIDFGLNAPARAGFAPQAAYAVLLHATARAAKLWTEVAWETLAKALVAKGLICVLPWGDAHEAARARRIAAAVPSAVVAPRMSIQEAAALLAHARVVVGIDTGLLHLAAAFSVPAVGIFCDSEPLDARPIGAGPTAYRGAIGRPPTPADVLDAVGEVVPALA